jgi:hypothetical protein
VKGPLAVEAEEAAAASSEEGCGALPTVPASAAC